VNGSRSPPNFKDVKEGYTMLQTTDSKGQWMQRVLAADTLTGDKVVNRQKEDLGTIEHLIVRGVPGYGR
jgi:hypothetical protein